MGRSLGVREGSGGGTDGLRFEDVATSMAGNTSVLRVGGGAGGVRSSLPFTARSLAGTGPSHIHPQIVNRPRFPPISMRIVHLT